MVGTEDMLKKLQDMETDVQLWEYNGGEVTETMSDFVALSKKVRKYLEGNKRSHLEEREFLVEFAFIVGRL